MLMNGKTALRNIIRRIQVNPKHFKLEEIGGEEQIIELDISSSRLVEIPDGLFEGLDHLRVLILEFNDLTKLDADVFSDLISLEILDLSRNNLESLPNGLFKNNSKLEKLYLSENRLRDVDEQILSSFTNLRHLDLHRNLLGEILSKREETFPPSLQVLNLRNNHIRELRPEIFRNLRDLRELDLSNNSIQSIIMENMENLEVLRLDHNHLTSIDVNSFIKMDKLKELHLNSNELIVIPPEAFAGKPLEYLDLRENPVNIKLRRMWETHNLRDFFETLEIFG